MVRYLFILIMVLIVNLGIFAQGSLPNRYYASYLNMASGMPNNFADDIFRILMVICGLAHMEAVWCAMTDMIF